MTSRLFRRAVRGLGCGLVVGMGLSAPVPVPVPAPPSLSPSSPAAANVAWCRPLDTPEYLVPYYLRSTKARFNHYASIRKKGGRRYMNAQDFLCALLGKNDKTLENPAAADDLAALFAAVDSNSDGRLSLGEFSFFLTILATKREDFINGFHVFNTSTATNQFPSDPLKASLSLPQFRKFMSAVGNEHVTIDYGNGIVKKLFGSSGTGRATAADILEVAGALSTEVWKAEFRQFDKKNRGGITPDKFGELIASHLVGSHLPFYLVENMRKMKISDAAASGGGGSARDKAGGGLVPFATWRTFSRIMEETDAIGDAVRMFTASGRALSKSDFSRAVVAAGLPPLSPRDLNLLFALFDSDGSGSIAFDEFATIARNRVSYHINSSIEGKERDSIATRFVKCGAEAVF